MPPLCIEAIPRDEACAQDQNGAIASVKPDALTSTLRTAMAAILVDAVFLYRLLRHPETRWYARGLLLLPMMYLCSPIQLMPNFIPVLGQIDDLLVIWITKKIVRELVTEKAWQECHLAAAATSFMKQFTSNHQDRSANGTT